MYKPKLKITVFETKNNLKRSQKKTNGLVRFVGGCEILGWLKIYAGEYATINGNRYRLRLEIEALALGDIWFQEDRIIDQTLR